MTDLTIIVPVYDDRESIIPMRDEIAASLKDAPFTYDVLFVDDGSTDNPREIFEANGLHSVSHPQNRGYGAAIKTGVQSAASEFICIIDCDGTYHPRDIVELMRHAPDHDAVVGARDPRENPWPAYLGKRLSCFLLGAVFEREVADINSGLRVMRRSTFIRHLPALRDRFSLTSSLTYGHLLDGETIKYVPIAYRKRAGATKVRRFPFTVEFVRCLAAVRRFRLERNAARATDGGRAESPASRRSAWLRTGGVFLACLLLAVAYDWQKLLNPYIVNDDARQHVFWMVSLHDPGLFSNNVITDYARYLTTPGVLAIYWLGTLVWDPVLFGKLLAVVLFALTGVALYKIGRLAGGEPGGLLTAFLFCGYPPLTLLFDGGLHRAFMFPLLALFLYLLVLRKYAPCVWVLGVQLLFYPICAVLSLGTFLFVLAADRQARASLKLDRAVLTGVVFVLVSLAAVGGQRQASRPAFLGSQISAAAMVTDGAFDRHGGRHTYLPFGSLADYARSNLLRDKSYFADSAYFKALVYLFPLFLLLDWLGAESPLARWLPLLSLAVMSALLFELAKLFYFKLYIPDRYLRYSFAIIGTVLAGWGACGVLGLIRSKVRRRVGALGIAGLGVLVCVSSEASYLPHHLVDETGRRRLYEYLRTTPRDAVVAADPFLSDNIQTFASRQVFVTYELAHAWYTGYRAIMDQRVLDFYDAYFSEEPLRIAGFMKRNGIASIVGDKSHFVPGALQHRQLYYQPLEKGLRQRAGDWARSDFALPRVARHSNDYDDDRFFVISAAEIERAAREVGER